jgi:hypothetical protein
VYLLIYAAITIAIAITATFASDITQELQTAR